ncbi:MULTISPECIES: hypothetical protein [Mycobacteroides]|uniref:Transmembrane protein n=1 Tax=Mycobacteroides chelonae TaxID=1774 RepID=A0A1S1LUF3_MYCCH|nr:MULTISPECIES: hypothetical protein [Mycobacteroides]KRQ18733.1 hypothetical protein AOT87_23445 [Mycobacteroides sp. H003]KRQ30409.1 hypothetical protein AOT91_14655 [Mycobacteroides sp. H092]KRQ36391.1 hypothetical protein AOT92_22950 [Mycobacteroides sp. H101]KRQ49568.1 hypothetical protein AOT88_11175 [Mycobacteroides sp. H063]KRQ55821.1 hypothetical protein AOT94_21725 [Mycobacteroides sp. HXVII]
MSDKNAENTVEKASAEAELVDDTEKPSIVEGDLADPLAVPIDGGRTRDGLDTATFTAFSAFKDDEDLVTTGRIDTDALPLTAAFDVASDRTGAMPVTSAESMTPDPYTGAVPVLADEPAKPVRVPAEREPAFLKRWVLLLLLLAVWIPAGAVGLLLYQHWFETLLPNDRTLAVTYVLIWVFVCVVVALLLAMVEPLPIVVALAFAVLTAPAISVAAAGVKYGYVACTAPSVPGVQSLCPEPLRSWGIQYRDRA